MYQLSCMLYFREDRREWGFTYSSMERGDPFPWHRQGCEWIRTDMLASAHPLQGQPWGQILNDKPLCIAELHKEALCLPSPHLPCCKMLLQHLI